MSLVRSVATFGYHQSKNIIKFFLGRRVTVTPLGSMTLDKDDVEIARSWIDKPEHWYDKEVVQCYNKEFAIWNGSKYAFSFMGGRVALSACIYALNLEPGDEVILPGYTCVVVPNAFSYAGIKPIYSDIELDTYGLDASQLEKKITPKTRVILLQHLYGLVCRDYEEIIELARRNNLMVIEDCAHSTGAEYKGLKVGNRGNVAFYSSEQSKVFSTVQGGVAVTNDDNIASRMRYYYEQASYPDELLIKKQLYNVLINYYKFKHPQRWWTGELAQLFYGNNLLVSTTEEEERGIMPSHYGLKMPTPIAAIGLNQLKKIDDYNAKRRKKALFWDEWCNKKGYKKPMVIPGSIPVYLRYPILIEPEKKQDSGWAYRDLGVTLGVWFVSHIHPIKRNVEGCPNADRAVNSCVNFPTLED